jgi:ATP-dependent Lhr-like helicase
MGVQQDAYRIVVQTSGSANGEKVAQTLRGLARRDVQTLVYDASKKTGLFKRRLVHVAKRFGAITKWADFGSVNLRQVMKSFEGTVIMEEAFKETMEKDLDVPNTIRVVQKFGSEIELVVASRTAEASPIARIGLERISRKTDLIPPEKMKRILVESVRVRILNESRTLACPTCLGYARIQRVKDMPTDFSCPNCKTGKLGISSELPELVEKIGKKKGRNLSEREERVRDDLKASSALLQKYGKVAAYVLSGRRISPGEAKVVLRRTHRMSDHLFESVMDAERRVLRRRFW